MCLQSLLNEAHLRREEEERGSLQTGDDGTSLKDMEVYGDISEGGNLHKKQRRE